MNLQYCPVKPRLMIPPLACDNVKMSRYHVTNCIISYLYHVDLTIYVCIAPNLYVSHHICTCPTVPVCVTLYLYVPHHTCMCPAIPVCVTLYLYVSYHTCMSHTLPVYVTLYLYVSACVTRSVSTGSTPSHRCDR